MGEALRTLDRRRGGRKDVCCVLRIASWLRVGPGSRAGGCSSPGGAGEASGGVCLVSFLWARVDSGLRHNLILLGSK